MKIFDNILLNPSEISKYGNLNFDRINDKLKLFQCRPALKILFVVGFVVKNIDNKQRLIWKNTTGNMKQIETIH